jgi:hypothetical protein
VAGSEPRQEDFLREKKLHVTMSLVELNVHPQKSMPKPAYLPRCRLLDLPTELLDTIFRDPTISTNALYLVSTLSRWLHYIALPIYLERHGILDLSRVAIFAEHINGRPKIHGLSGLH